MASSVDKKFGFCDTEWVIENFRLQTCGKSWVIDSPEFVIKGSENTKWQMILRPISVNRNYLVSLTLKRLKSDSEPVGEVVNLRIYVSVFNGKTFFFHEAHHFFNEEDKYETNLKKIGYFLEKMEPFEKDFLEVTLKMIVYSKKARSSSCVNSGMRSLSRDMMNLYKSGYNYDTKLIVGNNVILAHKAILSGRNGALRKLFDNEDSETDKPVLINCQHFKFKGLKKMLAYLYSSDIDNVVNNPSFDIHDCALSLETTEVIQLYTPEKILLRSSIDIQEFVFSWTVKDFERNCEQKDCVFHPFFIANNSIITCLLHFRCPNQTVDFIPLMVAAFQTTGSINISIEYAVDDKSKKDIKPARFQSSLKEFKSIEFEKFFKMHLVKSFNTGSCLSVSLKLQLSKNVKKSVMEKQETCYSDPVDEGNLYTSYALHMRNIFETGNFSDFVLKSFGHRFPIHKCILSCRSRTFFKKLNWSRKEVKVSKQKFKRPHILKLFLIFLYCGTISETTNDYDILELYKTAVKFQLGTLKSMCSVMLQERCETNANIRCKVLNLAEKNEDFILRDSVVNQLSQKKVSLESPVFIVFSLPFKKPEYIHGNNDVE